MTNTMLGPTTVLDNIPLFYLHEHTDEIEGVKYDNEFVVLLVWSETATFEQMTDPDGMPVEGEDTGMPVEGEDTGMPVGGGEARAYPSHLNMDDDEEFIQLETELNATTAAVHRITIKQNIDETGSIIHEVFPLTVRAVADAADDPNARRAPSWPSMYATAYDTRLPKPEFTQEPEVIFAANTTIAVEWNVPIDTFGMQHVEIIWSDETRSSEGNVSIVHTTETTGSIINVAFPVRHRGTVTINILAADLKENENGDIDGLVLKSGIDIIADAEKLGDPDTLVDFYQEGESAETIQSALNANDVSSIAELHEKLLGEDVEEEELIGNQLLYDSLIKEPKVKGGVSRVSEPKRMGPKAASSITIMYDTFSEPTVLTYGALNLHMNNPSTYLRNNQNELVGYYLEDEFGRLKLENGSVLSNSSGTDIAKRNGHEFLEEHVTFDNDPSSDNFLTYYRAKQNTGGYDGDIESPVTPADLDDTEVWEPIVSFVGNSEYIRLVFTWTAPTSEDQSDLDFKEAINFQYSDIQIIQYDKDESTGNYTRYIEPEDDDEDDEERMVDADIKLLYRVKLDGTTYSPMEDNDFHRWDTILGDPNEDVPKVYDGNAKDVIDNVHNVIVRVPSSSVGAFEIVVGTQDGNPPDVIVTEAPDEDADEDAEPKKVRKSYLIRTKQEFLPAGTEPEDNEGQPRAARDRRNRYEPGTRKLAINDSPEFTVTSGPVFYDTRTDADIHYPGPGIDLEPLLCIEREISNNEILNDMNTDSIVSESFHSNSPEHSFTMDAMSEVEARFGAAFTSISDMIHKGNDLYFVVQIQRRDPQDKYGVSNGLKGAAALCHVDTSGTPNSMRVLKTYVQAEDAARSLAMHQGFVYFFEGSHYQHVRWSKFDERDTNTERYNDFTTGDLYKINDLRLGRDPIKLEYQAGGWQSDVTVTDELANFYRASTHPDIGPYLPHDATVSPIVSTEPKTSFQQDAELSMITGGSDAGSGGYLQNLLLYYTLNDETVMLADTPTSDINNWIWVRYARTIEQRISHLVSNKQKPFDLIKEFAYLTNSTMGFETGVNEETGEIENQFFMRPRDPYTAKFVSISGSNLNYKENNRDFSELHPSGGETRLLLINDELIGYTNHTSDDSNMLFGGIIRGYSGTTQFEHQENNEFVYIEHIIDLEISAYDPPIIDLKYRDDSTQLYNQVEINYGLEEDFKHRYEDVESVITNGEKETSFNVPLDRHQLPWIEYLGKQFIERNKDMKYMFTLVLKPTLFLKLGQTILIRQRWRDKSKDGWHIFVACQVYDMSQSFDDNTTTCVFRTI